MQWLISSQNGIGCWMNPAIEHAVKRGLGLLRVEAPMRLSQWAAKHFYLSAESSYVEQHWDAWPFQPAIMDAMSNDAIREVNVKKAARVGYTKMFLAAIAYFAEHKKRNQAVWQPTDDDSDDFCKTELEPMLRDVPIMESVFPMFQQRHKDNTLKQKKFLGSILHLRGGKAAKNYRRISVDVAHIDELDGFDQDIEKEGDAQMLSGKRLEGATFPKHILGSTPKIKNYSQIEAREQQADARFQYYIPCPHCGHEHPLQWGGPDKPLGMKWMDNNPSTVQQMCPDCRALYTQDDYLSVWKRGRWIDQNGGWFDENGEYRNEANNIEEPPEHVAFTNLWTAYSPQATWEKIVKDFLAAKDKAKRGDMSSLKTWINTTRGETYEVDVDKTDEHLLKKRAEDYQLRTVPLGGLVLVAGVDVQDNRFEIVVWAIGRGEEMWPIDYMVIDANPADERDWLKLNDYLQTKFKHSAGGYLAIEAAAVDSGGHFTHQVYGFCRHKERRRIVAIKGDNQTGKPVKGRASMQDINYRGKVIKRGVKLWLVGVDTAKDLLYGRLQVTTPGPGYVHFSDELPDEFYHQLTGEHRIPVKTARGEDYRWVRIGGRRVEVLDCTVYAIFASHLLGLNSYTDRMWEKLEDAVQPVNGNLFDAEEPVENQQKPETRTPPKTTARRTAQSRYMR